MFVGVLVGVSVIVLVIVGVKVLVGVFVGVVVGVGDGQILAVVQSTQDEYEVKIIDTPSYTTSVLSYNITSAQPLKPGTSKYITSPTTKSSNVPSMLNTLPSQHALNL